MLYTVYSPRGNALSHCSFEDAILNFLYDHIDKSGENQARVKWEPNTVVIWDNRVTAHVCPDLFLVGTHFTKLGVQSAILCVAVLIQLGHRRCWRYSTCLAPAPWDAWRQVHVALRHCRTF